MLLIGGMMPVLVSTGSPQQQPATQNQRGAPQASAEMAEAASLTASVMKLYQEGKYDEALPLAKRVLEISERVLKPDDESIILALINMGEIQLARGRPDEATKPFERALKACERTKGPADTQLSRVLDSLSLAYHALGRTLDTENAYKRALDVRERALGLDHPEVSRSILRLAQFYQYEGEYKKADPLYQRLVAIREKQGAGDALAEALDGYACLLRKTSHEEQAVLLEERSQGILHPDDPTMRPLNGGILNGKALSLAMPQYPYLARTVHIRGTVLVQVLIDESGKVVRACAVEGPNLLMKASESSAMRSRFSPTRLDGKPVKVIGTITYNFMANPR